MKPKLGVCLALLFGALLIVSGCASPKATSGTPIKSATHTARKPPPPKNNGPLERVSLSGPKAPSPAPRKPKPKPIYAPSRLNGLSGNDVGALLGPPSFKRHDSPAQVWQYGGDDCLLDVFLYGKDGGETLTVAHSEARSRDGAEMKQKDCMISLIKERRTGSS